MRKGLYPKWVKDRRMSQAEADMRIACMEAIAAGFRAPPRPQAFLAWAVNTFGSIARDRGERVARFIEEALELAQAEGFPRHAVAFICNRVYSRAPSEFVAREVGQAQATLECLAENIGLSADAEAAREFARVQTIPKEEWQRRHAAKVAAQIAKASNA
jgi:hypothetical protein